MSNVHLLVRIDNKQCRPLQGTTDMDRYRSIPLMLGVNATTDAMWPQCFASHGYITHRGSTRKEGSRLMLVLEKVWMAGPCPKHRRSLELFSQWMRRIRNPLGRFMIGYEDILCWRVLLGKSKAERWDEPCSILLDVIWRLLYWI